MPVPDVPTCAALTIALVAPVATVAVNVIVADELAANMPLLLPLLLLLQVKTLLLEPDPNPQAKILDWTKGFLASIPQARRQPLESYFSQHHCRRSCSRSA